MEFQNINPVATLEILSKIFIYFALKKITRWHLKG